jgi:two-component system heavy metal sensor histidine kinase CusS
MSQRARYTAAISAISLVTLGVAFAVVSQVVNASQERQLDLALIHEAREEAVEADALGGDELAISGRPGPAANDVGPLTKYAVIYDGAGAVIDQTPSWRRHPPARATLPAPGGACFDLYSEEEHLRAVHVDLPAHDGVSLLLAAPRTDLDGDARFLARAMATVLAIAALWTVLVTFFVVRQLTAGHRTIAEVARRVAAGDLDARIRMRRGSVEVVQLARDLDAMIDRLGLLLGHQQRFIANAAHELRSPLTTLYGELSHALRRSREPAEYERAIREALESTARLRRMAEDLLAVARMGGDSEAPTEPVALVEVADEALALVRDEAERGAVTVVRDGPDARVLGRAPDLVRLVRNLLENAIRHSPAGSRVTLRCRSTDDRVELRVIDEGPGVPEGERERIFEAFYRGARERATGDGGTGLGLTIVREIARAHGGDIRLDAGDGPGAAFTLSLPRAP